VRLQRQQPEHVERDQQAESDPREVVRQQEGDHRHHRQDHRGAQVEGPRVVADVLAQQAVRPRVEHQPREDDQRREQQPGDEPDRGAEVVVAAERVGQHDRAERGQRVDAEREDHQQRGVVVDAAHPRVEPPGLQPARDHGQEADGVRPVLRAEVEELGTELAGRGVLGRAQLDDQQRRGDRVDPVDERAEPSPPVRRVLVGPEAPAPRVPLPVPRHAGEASG